MAIIRLRSPYFYKKTKSGTYGSADLSITIGGTQRYLLRKDTTDVSGTATVMWEVSELLRDYLDVTWDGTTLPYPSNRVVASLQVDWFTLNKQDRAQASSTPTAAASDTAETFYGFDAYSFFNEGSNKTITASSLLQSNTSVFIPDGVTAYIPKEDGANGINYHTILGTVTDGTVVDIANVDVTVNRICDPVHTIVQLVFVNKFGALQELWFNKKSVENFNSTNSEYANLLTTATSHTYSSTQHQNYVYNKQGKRNITLNTGYVDETIFQPLQELILSENVWAKIDNVVYPVKILTKQLEKKTRINNKIIDYTIECEFAFDVINSVR